MNDIYYVIGGHIIKPFTFSIVFPTPQPLRSVSGSSLSCSSPPLLIQSTAFQSGCCFVFRLNLKTITASILRSLPGGRKYSPSPKAYVLPLGEQSTIPIRFNNEFGVNVNWDPNKCRIIRDETGILSPFSATVKTLFTAFLGLRPVALGYANCYNKPQRPGMEARSLGRSEGGDRRNQEKIIATGEIIAKENRLIRSVSIIGLRLHMIVMILFL